MCYSAFLSNFLEAKSELLTSTGLYVNSANLFLGHITLHCCHQLGNALGSSIFITQITHEGAAIICGLNIFQIAMWKKNKGAIF